MAEREKGRNEEKKKGKKGEMEKGRKKKKRKAEREKRGEEGRAPCMSIMQKLRHKYKSCAKNAVCFYPFSSSKYLLYEFPAR